MRGVGVLSELIVTAVDSAHSLVRWRAAILLRSIAMVEMPTGPFSFLLSLGKRSQKQGGLP